MADLNHPLTWGQNAYREALEAEPVEVTFDLWKGPNGEPFKFWVFPIGGGELDAITREGANGGLSSHYETIIQRCKREDGTRIFQPGHRAELKRTLLDDHILLLTSLINRAIPVPAFDLEAALKR